MQDLKLINILLSSKKELSSFSESVDENIIHPDYRKFVKHIVYYYRSFNSCPTLETLLDFNGKNAQLQDYLKTTWNEIQKYPTDPREYGFILSKLVVKHNIQIIKESAPQLYSVDENNIEYINSSILKLTSDIKGLGKKAIYKEIELKNYVEEWKQRFQAKAKNPDLARGIFSGFSMLDYYTNGIKPSELFCVGGASGSGKSIFLINLAVNMFMGKNRMPGTFDVLCDMVENNRLVPANDVLFISLEMPAEEITDRILSCMASVNSLDISKGLLHMQDVDNIKKALYYWENSLNHLKIVDVPRGCSVYDVEKIYNDCCLEFKPKVIIIDYMGLMTTSKNEDAESDWIKLETVSEELHELTRSLNTSCWSALQLTQSEKQGKAGVGAHRIARAKGIIRNLNLFLEIEDREDESMRSDSCFHCIKFRRGPTFIMNNLRKEFQYTRFADLGFSPDKKQNPNKQNEDLTKAIEALDNKKDDIEKDFDKLLGG